MANPCFCLQWDGAKERGQCLCSDTLLVPRSLSICDLGLAPDMDQTALSRVPGPCPMLAQWCQRMALQQVQPTSNSSKTILKNHFFVLKSKFEQGSLDRLCPPADPGSSVPGMGSLSFNSKTGSSFIWLSKYLNYKLIKMWTSSLQALKLHL